MWGKACLSVSDAVNWGHVLPLHLTLLHIIRRLLFSRWFKAEASFFFRVLVIAPCIQFSTSELIRLYHQINLKLTCPCVFNSSSLHLADQIAFASLVSLGLLRPNLPAFLLASLCPFCAHFQPLLFYSLKQLSHNNAPTSWNVAMLCFKCFVVSSDWVKRRRSVTRTQHLLAFRGLLWPLPLHFVFSVDTMFPVVSVTLCVFSFLVPHSVSSKNKLEACLYCYFFLNS